MMSIEEGLDEILEVLCPDRPEVTNHPARLRKQAKHQILELIKQARIDEGKKSYTRGYNAGYAGAKRGGSKRGDDALKNWIISIIDERLNQLSQQTPNN